MKQKVSYREFYEWLCYKKVNGPFGWRRNDWLTAMILCQQYGKGDKELKEFLPQFVSDDSGDLDWDDPQTVEKEMEKTLNVFKQITLAMGGEVSR